MIRILGRAVAVWCAIAFAETLHGILRGLFITPVFGDLGARQVGVFVGAAIIVAIACVLIRWVGAKTTQELFAVGSVWLLLMLAFEIGLGRLLGFSWARILSDYDPRQGGLMLIGMAILFLAPFVATRVRGAIEPRGAADKARSTSEPCS